MGRRTRYAHRKLIQIVETVDQRVEESKQVGFGSVVSKNIGIRRRSILKGVKPGVKGDGV